MGIIGDVRVHPGCARWGDASAFIIITDLPGPFRSGSQWQPTGAHWNGQFTRDDGSSLVWECSSPDGKTGIITVNGKTFDLADGSLLLLTTEKDSVVVTQFERDTLQMVPETAIQTVFQDSDVRKFFGEDRRRDGQSAPNKADAGEP